MTLPSSGAISTSQISQEIYGNTTTPITIPDSNTRLLTGVASGPIVLPDDFWGKTWTGGTVLNFSVTSGTNGATHGYSRSTYGSITPEPANIPWDTDAFITLFNSTPVSSVELNILIANYGAADPGFTVVINSRTFDTSTATRTTVGASQQFQWSGGTPLFTGAGATYAGTMTRH